MYDLVSKGEINASNNQVAVAKLATSVAAAVRHSGWM